MPIINKGIFDTGDAFLRQTGNDWPTAQVISTADVIESSSNLYFTNTRAINALTIGTVTGNIAITGTLIANGLIIRNIAVSDSVLTGSTAANNIVADTVTSNIWNRLYTANVIETAGNLYFTNARVAANVATLLKSFQGSGLTIDAANGQINISAAASANFASNATVANTVLSLAGLTTTNLNEGSNLYFTPARVLSSISAGQGIAISANGIIQTLGNDTGLGLFNSGINLQGNAIASSAYSNVKSFVAGEGNSFIAFSLHVTNLAANTSYLTGRTITDGNVVLFANLLEVPVGGSLEIFRKPQVFRIGDSIQVQGLNNNKVADDGLISTYLSYQGSVDDNFRRSAITLTDNTLVPLLQTISRTSIIESINLVNLGANIIPTSVFLTDAAGVVQATLASNLLIPAYASVELCEYPKSLPDNWYVKAQKFDNPSGSLSVYTSSKFTSSFTAIPSTTSITEFGSNTVTFNILTTNILDNTLLYYATDALGSNMLGSDFVTANTGTVTVLNNQATLTLTANSDQNTNFEGDETFKVVFRKGSSTGSVVLTTDIITLRDTSNTIVYNSLVESDATIAEGASVTFTLNTTNLGPNNTIYYTTVGNAIITDFVTGNTGSFLSTGNSFVLSIATNSNIPANETRYFQLQLRTGSLTGPVQITSNVITVVDALQAFVVASGGTEYINDGFKTHVFTSSGNFLISGLGLPTNRNLYYEIVAGGGAGGTGYYAGGGGAGGFLQGNTTLTTTGTFATVVGGGAGGQYSSPGGYVVGGRGSNSSIFANTFIAIGGGNGGAPGQSPTNGIPGGSGGGGSLFAAGGTGTPEQGYPGSPSGPYAQGAGGGGAGQIGHISSPPGYTVGGNGRSSVSITNIPAQAQPLYGTPGRGLPGKWFAGGGQGGQGGPNNPTNPNSAGNYNAGGGGRSGEPSAANGQPGGQYTGGGGGGDGGNGGSGSGGSGVVILRYPYTAETYGVLDDVGASKVVTDNVVITYNLTTINVANTSTLYWTLSGNIANADVRNGNTGSFTVLNSNATFSVSLANSIVSGSDTKAFTLQLRKNSATGSIVATAANTITVYAGSNRNNFINATGGTVIDSGGYRTHVLASSNTFAVSSAGSLGGYVNYIIVAGGGAGGPGHGSYGQGGGGGGAGGFVQGITTVSAQSYVANVGAGGSSNSRGSNSSIFSMIAVGGGRVVNNSTPGVTTLSLGGGGSGGGANDSGNNGEDHWGGGGISGQGYPGGFTNGQNPPNGSGTGGGGAGGAGGGANSGGGTGLSLSWVPTSYGTAGPAPGRYFAGGGGTGGADPGYQGRPATGGSGGSGGGGTGGYGLGGNPGFTGNVNTGGGGGGGGCAPGGPGIDWTGGLGGSGIIIIRYPYV